MPPGVGAGDIFAPFADDDREFGFVIELGGNPGVSQNKVAIRHYRAWRFGENNGNRWSVLAILRRRIKSRLLKLPGVLPVILADAKNVPLGCDGGKHPDAVQRLPEIGRASCRARVCQYV